MGKLLLRADSVITVNHVQASEQQYIGSPSIESLPDGRLVCSHDLFGPGSSCNTTFVYHSYDLGNNWKHVSTISGQFWSSLFVLQGELYILGTSCEGGHVVIRRSRDGGCRWTHPDSQETGLLLNDGIYHCAPTPVLVHDKRVYRAMEDMMGPGHWGTCFRSFVISAPLGCDLLKAANWTKSNVLPRDACWLNGRFGGWLEGNVVADRNGKVMNILRVHTTDHPEYAAIVDIVEEGATSVFNPDTGFVPFPGGGKKFTIRFDPFSTYYWTLCNYVPPSYRGRAPAETRNTLCLARSRNLRKWEIRTTLLHHPEPVYHGYQYADWQFAGSDLIAVIRTADDDEHGGAHNHHDANYLRFARIPHFRCAIDSN